MTQGKDESTDDYAARVRGSSVAYMGKNTIADMKTIAKQSTGANKEIAFVGSISETREIRLTAMPIDESNGYNFVKIRWQLDDNYSKEEQGKFFLFGHIHHDGFVRNVPGLTAASKLWNLGKPTDPDDYQPRLRGADGQMRQTPAIIGTTGGFSIYGTGTSNTYDGTRHLMEPLIQDLYC